ncbi:MAG: hypothetical protein BWK80_54700 [Desulfobacteraceae bacterium IS3]|nr:MAG: hypothetical protein BWK80_54700 [Desulfobacteraceae bacterium IS3]
MCIISSPLKIKKTTTDQYLLILLPSWFDFRKFVSDRFSRGVYNDTLKNTGYKSCKGFMPFLKCFSIGIFY